MIYDYFTISAHILKYIEIFLSISLLLSSLQHLRNINCFSSEGLLPWNILKKKKVYLWLRNDHYNFIFSKTGMLWLNIIRITLLPLFLYSSPEIFMLTLIILTLISFLIYLRTSLMSNAADQVNNIALAGLLINQIFGSHSSDSLIIYFFALLLIVSYFTSGLLKIYETKWRNGIYLKQVLIMRNYGNPILIKLIDSLPEHVYLVLSQIIVFWQLSSFLMPFFPSVILYFYLFIGLCFHLTTGILMRLNGFIWTFTAFLPTIIYLHSKLSACLLH